MRDSNYSKTAERLRNINNYSDIYIGNLAKSDCDRIASKMFELRVNIKINIPNQSALSDVISTRERGYKGDLFAALYAIVHGTTIGERIATEYQMIESSADQEIVRLVALTHHLGIKVPLKYVCDILSIKIDTLRLSIDATLSGIIQYDFEDRASLTCRHRIIATTYVSNFIKDCIAPSYIVDILRYVGVKFTVPDIANHPLPYRIYKALISAKFLLKEIFTSSGQKDFALQVYSDVQDIFNEDGFFWTQFGNLLTRY